MEIKYWAGTDVGRKRSDNEDNFLIDKRLKLFVVADGMGGHASGEIASAMAVHGIREVLDQERDILDVYDDDDPKSHVEVCTLLEYAVHHTCAQIFYKARREPEKRGMGTTLVVLLVIGARGFIAYVGDSRIYLLRGGIVYQLTEDHSLRNELIRMGKITADEFETSPYANLKNAMTRAVGVYESVEVDTLDFDIIPGDAFLLCSDGLYEYLSDDDIANALAMPEIREIPGMLIDSANSRGGKDNITAVVVQVAGGDDDHDRAAELNFTLDTLKNVPLFRELSYQQLVRVINLARQSALEPGEVLCREGEPGHELLVVLRGRLRLTREGVTVAELGAGAHLGEMSLIDAGPRSATATAMEPGKVLGIGRDDFYEVLRREPALAVKLLWSFVRVLADRLRNTTADLASARTTAAAIVPDLTELAEDAGRSDPLRPILELDELDPLDPSASPDEDDEDELERRPTMVLGMRGPLEAQRPGTRTTRVGTTTKPPQPDGPPQAMAAPTAAEAPSAAELPSSAEAAPDPPPAEAPPPSPVEASAPPQPRSSARPSSAPRSGAPAATAPLPEAPRVTEAPLRPDVPVVSPHAPTTAEPSAPPPQPHPSSGAVRTGGTVAPPSAAPRRRPASDPFATGDSPFAPTTAPRPRRGPQVTKPTPGTAWSPSLRPTKGAPVVASPQAPTAPLDAPHLRPPPELDAPTPRGRDRHATLPPLPPKTPVGLPSRPAPPAASSSRGNTQPSPLAAARGNTQPSALAAAAAERGGTMPPLPPSEGSADTDAPRVPAPRRASPAPQAGRPVPPRAPQAGSVPPPIPEPDDQALENRRTQTGIPVPPRVPPPPPTARPKSGSEAQDSSTPILEPDA